MAKDIFNREPVVGDLIMHARFKKYFCIGKVTKITKLGNVCYDPVDYKIFDLVNKENKIIEVLIASRYYDCKSYVKTGQFQIITDLYRLRKKS